MSQTSQRWRLEARRPNGELQDYFHGTDAELREQAETMAPVHGQKYWKYDLYCGNALQATYRRGVWKEHGEKKA